MTASRPRVRIALLGCLLLLAWVASLLEDAGTWPFQGADAAWNDAMLRHAAAPASGGRSVVVDIDDASLAAVGQWPWPRYRIAQLLDRIAADKPAAIGMDILFPEPDRTSVSDMQSRLRRDFGLDVSIQGVPQGLLDNDGFLAERLAKAGVVGASYLYFDRTTTGSAPSKSAISFDGPLDRLSLEDASGELVDAPGLREAVAIRGFINCAPDPDGVLRRLPLVLLDRGRARPSLALATAMQATGARVATMEVGRDGDVLRFGDRHIPVDASGRARVVLREGRTAYAVIPAVDILAGRVPASALAGRAVVLGSSAVGLHDAYLTGTGERVPGVVVQAAMVDALLEGDVPVVPAWRGTATGLACLLVAFCLWTLGATRRILWKGALATLFVALAAAACSIAAFRRDALLLTPTAPILVAAVSWLLMAGIEQFSELRSAVLWKRRLDKERQVTIESMASVAETRDPETGAHIKRTQHYVKAIALELRRRGQHERLLTDGYIELLFLSAPLHDVGKVGIPDHILLKPDRLGDEEMAIMRGHAELGRRIIHGASQGIDGDNYLVVAGEIAATHHERWDGTGYPLGLRGDHIPLSGRIMAVADVYDALISRRCYKPPYPHAHAMTLMRAQRGTTFDPDVLDAFVAIEEGIVEIAARFRDEAGTPVKEGDAVGSDRMQELAAGD